MRLAGTAMLWLLASAGAAAAQVAAPADPPAAELDPGAPAPSPRPSPTAATPDAAACDLAYDTRLRASFAAAESFQGPLDGGWTLSAPGQGDLFGLQLVDRRGQLEGAWRDLRRTGAGSLGLIERISRTGDAVTLSFTPDGRAPVTVALQARGQALSGALDEAGRRTAVTLRRTGP